MISYLFIYLFIFGVDMRIRKFSQICDMVELAIGESRWPKKSGHMTHDQVVVVVKESFSIDFHYPLIFFIFKKFGNKCTEI